MNFIDDTVNIESVEEKIYKLQKIGCLEYNEILWYQSFNAFRKLIELANVNSGKFAKDIRILVSKNFNVTNDDEIIDKISECYKEQKIDPPQNVGKFLDPNSKIERWTLIKLLYALKINREEFDNFLKKSSARALNPSDPKELILIYLLRCEIYNWETFIELAKIAENYVNDSLEIFGDATTIFTHLEPDNLQGMDIEIFSADTLKKCCEESVTKVNFLKKQTRNKKNYPEYILKQHSATALDFMVEYSIINDVDKGRANTNIDIYDKYQSVFSSDIVSRYSQNFHLERYGLILPDREKIFSQDLYVRFLNYRLMRPCKDGNTHNTGFFSYANGKLAQELTISLLKYSEINARKEQSHRINRADILVTFFYYFLMKYWSNEKISFFAESSEAAQGLWNDFIQDANEILEDTGYSPISVEDNLLDNLLEISLSSISPLETYNRVYELNILSSFAKSTDENQNYPDVDRMNTTLIALDESHKKLQKYKIIDAKEYSTVQEFIAEVKKEKLPR